MPRVEAADILSNHKNSQDYTLHVHKCTSVRGQSPDGTSTTTWRKETGEKNMLTRVGYTLLLPSVVPHGNVFVLKTKYVHRFVLAPNCIKTFLNDKYMSKLIHLPDSETADIYCVCSDKASRRSCVWRTC